MKDTKLSILISNSSHCSKIEWATLLDRYSYIKSWDFFLPSALKIDVAGILLHGKCFWHHKNLYVNYTHHEYYVFAEQKMRTYF
jgi:hypothetical protein